MSQQQSAAAGDIQERIAAARREAESLKEKIRAKKESTADTSRKFSHEFFLAHVLTMASKCGQWQLKSMPFLV
jgi:hypothetical protein